MNDLTPPAYLDEAPVYEGEIISPARTGTVRSMENPFGSSQADHVSAGTVAIQSSAAAAEVQGRMLIAKRFQRDAGTAYAKAMQACQRPGLAEVAIYAYNRGGSKVEGPSIRLAEEMARCWGNIEYGLRELSRRDGESEMEAFAWDLETNTRSSQNFTVRHIRDKKGGGSKLTDERDVYEITANMGARRLRARILAILPPELVEGAVAACRHTIKHGGTKSMPDRIREMTGAFASISVTPEMLVARLSHPIDQITPDELVDLRGIFQSIREQASAVGDWFGPKKIGPVATEGADEFEKAAAGQADAPKPDRTVTASEPTAPQAAESTKTLPFMERVDTWLASCATLEAVDEIENKPIIQKTLTEASKETVHALNGKFAARRAALAGAAK
jgi:hypothetical protein